MVIIDRGQQPSRSRSGRVHINGRLSSLVGTAALIATVVAAVALPVSAQATTPVGYTLSVVAGTGSPGTPTAGPATSSNLKSPSNVAVDASGDLYIADTSNEEVEKVTTLGSLSIIAGTGHPGTPTPGPATSSKLFAPSGVAVNASGDVYIADSNNSVIEKVTPSGTLSVFAGTGVCCNLAPVPGPATASQLWSPSAIAVDSTGNVYVASGQRILKITPSGTLSIVVGTGQQGAPTPGPALSSKLNNPADIAVDASGNLYLTDQTDNEILKVTPSGTLSIIAGDGQSGTPTPGPATSSAFNDPHGLAVDGAGNIYVGDSQNELIEKIAPSGTLSIIAGTGSFGPPTPGPATSSELFPFGLAVNSAGDVFVADLGNNVVEKVAPPPATAPTAPIAVSAATGYHSATVVWKSPLKDGGSPITGYKIFEGTSVGGESTTPVATVGALVTSAKVVNLTPWKTYYFDIKAVNAAGSSAPSGELSAQASTETLGGSQTTLAVGQQLFSSNGDYRMILQNDGNLVVYNVTTLAPLFVSVTNGTNKGHLLALSDGSLKLTDAAGKIVWSPKAKSGYATSLVLGNDGNLMLTTTTNVVLWIGSKSNPGG